MGIWRKCGWLSEDLVTQQHPRLHRTVSFAEMWSCLPNEDEHFYLYRIRKLLSRSTAFPPTSPKTTRDVRQVGIATGRPGRRIGLKIIGRFFARKYRVYERVPGWNEVSFQRKRGGNRAGCAHRRRRASLVGWTTDDFELEAVVGGVDTALAGA